MKTLLATCALLALVASAAVAADNPPVAPAPAAVSAAATPEAGALAPPTESAKGFAPGTAEYRAFVGGCTAIVDCPVKTGGGTRWCASRAANGCVERQDATPPWVACDGIVSSCHAIVP